jgi:hypothetical protein
MPTLRKRIELPVSAAEAFAWHERAGALERLTPPWAAMTVEQPPANLHVGSQVVLRTGIGPIRPRWVAEHVVYDPPHEFRDVQRSGPFALWDHRHLFTDLPGGRCALIDEVRYRLPFGRLGQLLAGRFIDRRLQAMFDYRHAQTRADLAALAIQDEAPMKVAITGASGLIGRSLTAFLTSRGHEVFAMVRRPPRDDSEIRWDPETGRVDTERLRGVDAVVHLAADPISPRPLTAAKKRSMRDSRVHGTRTIAEALARMDDGPRTLISASGSNIYGDRGDEVLTEASAPGSGGFMCEIVKEWEAATLPAGEAGVRVVLMRTGIVLDRGATILQVLGTVTRLGGAAPLGTGRQYWPWVSLDEAVGLYHHALTHPEISGPFNACGPESVTNEEFTRTLAKVLHRPVLPLRIPRAVPALLLRRELADSLLFTSMRMRPDRAIETGYQHVHPTLEAALRHLYGR